MIFLAVAMLVLAFAEFILALWIWQAITKRGHRLAKRRKRG
jgi:hypothetical protein